jgi:hypothetical protein
VIAIVMVDQRRLDTGDYRSLAGYCGQVCKIERRFAAWNKLEVGRWTLPQM